MGGGDRGNICLSAELGFYLIFFKKEIQISIFLELLRCALGGGESPLRLASHTQTEEHHRGALRLWGAAGQGWDDCASGLVG